MKSLISSSSLIIAFLWTAILPVNAQVNVTQKNNNLSRDGLYIDAAFTPGNAANLARDLSFNGTISGNVHAQPLYIEGGPNGPMVIVVTASNNVYALNADDWHCDLVAHRHRPCGNFRSSVRQYQSGWNHWHARRRSRVAIAFLRCIDRWQAQETFCFFVECRHRRDEFRVAGGCEY